ncbi:MAG TPA: hypothetical protein VNS63_02520, partial [Blastocatellia bacterium]|nr:hypothetical protein [Blastocatellia bacterium]
MRISRQSALKLLLILASVCLYSFVSFADTGGISRDAEATFEAAPAIADAPPAEPSQSSSPCDPAATKTKLWGMTAEEARCRSVGCTDCHRGIEDMHNGKVNLGCVDCHGGHAEVRLPAGASKGSAEYKNAQSKAHILPRFPGVWKTSANPRRSYSALTQESAEFVRFVNPGDLRVAAMSCGTSECHTR